MGKAVLLPAMLMVSALAGCVSETVYLSQGRKTGEVMFQPSQAALTRMNLGLEYLRRGDTGQAKFNLERALSQDGRNPDIHLALAYFFQSVSDHDKAEQHYRQVLQLDPQHGDGLNNYGAFLCDRERFDEADVMFRKAISVFGYAKVADTLENAALCALEGGQSEAAQGYFQRALEYSPNKPRALLGMAGLELERGDPVFARLYLDRYRQRHSPSAQSLWMTVRTARAQGLESEAQQAGAELVHLFPDSEQARRFLTHDY
ncbi:type IV pilus biogenesis/stability protein PilW [Oceanimonas marisflavi]|uniref:type IV pilus biogenesis/stability protein PilW n=1 Tax=Oceanimonas marisflavi TaxID=2059724 RepID=UPI0018E56558|nr:type IV pilus biogenesis/stability protein PilW [Oceanimonas marisflavi]